MSQSLYSKYRPRVFDDVVGQKHILQTIKNAVNTNKVSHAYMFCGPRGTGKTTMARLLAKACICTNAKDQKQPSVEFCGTCKDCVDIASGNHADVYELDAASRTGVENVREEIISRVGFAATRSNKKIYIIDEVHMLSTAAFNALLKTLEEPPSHVIFILCTTDLQKVPETILSRCQRFDFHAISHDDIVDRLKYVCLQEQVTASDDALEILTKSAQGAMRNALTSLELAIAYSKGDITKESVLQLSAQSATINFVPLLEAVAKKDLPKVFAWSDKQNQDGNDFVSISLDIAQIVRDLYIEVSGGQVNTDFDIKNQSLKTIFSAEQLHRFLSILSDLMQEYKITTNAQLSFEIALSKMCLPESDTSYESLVQRVASLEHQINRDNYKVVNTETKKDDEDIKKKKEVKEKEEFQKFNKPILNTKNNNNDSLNNEQGNIIEEKAFNEESSNHIEEDIKNITPPNITTPNIKVPDIPQPLNFSEERQQIKEQTGYDKKMNPQLNLERKEDLEKAWKDAYTNIRNKFPAYGAILSTAAVSYDKELNHFVLSFPSSSDFAFKLMNKPDNRQLLNDEISQICNFDIVVDVKVDDSLSKDDEISPEFVNEFRKEEPTSINTSNSYIDGLNNNEDIIPDPDFIKNKEEKSKETILNDSQTNKSFGYNTGEQSTSDSGESSVNETNETNMKDMLSNLGAYNFHEEE